jgi:hypothetical protein
MMAEEEHRRIKERTTAGRQRAMERDNAPPGGPLTFGYTLDGRGHFVPDPVESAIVIRMFEMVLEGKSQYEILAWVKTTGVRAGLKAQKRTAGAVPAVVKGQEQAEWHLTKVGRILHNRTYIGERTWGKRTFPCTPLVDAQTFEKVQALTSVRGRRLRSRRLAADHGLLSGLLTCGICGSRYYHKSHSLHRKGRTYRTPLYVCSSINKGKKSQKTCNGKMVRVSQLDRDVWEVIESYLHDPAAVVRKIVQADKRVGGQVADLQAEEARLAKELEALDAEAAQVWEEQKKNGWPLAWVTPRLNELAVRRDKAVNALATVRRTLSATLLDKEESLAVTGALAQIRARLKKGLSQEDKREIVRLMVAGGTVRTTGRGQHKSAEITIDLRWGESLSPDCRATRGPGCGSAGPTSPRSPGTACGS